VKRASTKSLKSWHRFKTLKIVATSSNAGALLIVASWIKIILALVVLILLISASAPYPPFRVLLW
jgi:hypothetical protein